jgi:outer membrane lipoprotein-sorting protein
MHNPIIIGGKMKVNKAVCFVFVCFVITFSSAATFALTPEEILKKTDVVRCPFETFVMDVDITSLLGNMSLKVYSKRGEGMLVRFLKPATQKGNLLLMKGDDPWMYMPGIHQAFKVTETQKLMGGISNGDLVRLRWSMDYDAKLIREDEKSYELELISKNKSSTYYRIEILIEKDSFKPLRSKAYLQSGKLSKTMYYTGFELFSGKLMPTNLKFIDHLRNQEESKMVFSNVRYQEIPENYFNKDTLPRLSETLNEK